LGPAGLNATLKIPYDKEMIARIQNFLQHPLRVFWACLFLVAASLIGSGSALTLYGLHRDSGQLKQQILQTQAKVKELEQALRQAQDPSYIQRQALDRYELAESDDLVFVFSDEN
jgi:cell division protein FtsB